MKIYEINGVANFAHCVSYEIEAMSAKEAKKIAESKAGNDADASMAEYGGVTLDKPILIKDLHPLN